MPGVGRGKGEATDIRCRGPDAESVMVRMASAEVPKTEE